MPILKGRDGEFSAVAELTQAQVPHLLPLFEVAPTESGPMKDALSFGVKVRRSVPADLIIAVDTRYLPDLGRSARGPLRSIAQDLEALQVLMLPVLHLHDEDHQITDARYAASIHDGQAVLRLGDQIQDPDDAEADQHLDRLMNDADLTTDQCHLLLDLFDVRSERDVTRAEPVARKCISWAQDHEWRSITVAAGAMPKSISDLPVNSPTALPRWDQQLWQRVRSPNVRYGDYGIAHPQMTGRGWTPMPSVRYTSDDAWWIYRWQQDKGARHAMYDLCKALTSANHWPYEDHAFSWGDQQIAARSAGMAGPGNATNWRAWGTSHHLAYVIRELDAVAVEG